MVGTAGIFSFEMAVPGATLPVAGVTMVSVRPTHRRRGILTGMMRQQLREIRERGEAAAALWASESLIYGRFGYGLSSQNADLRIDRVRTELRYGTAADGVVREVTKEEALELFPAVYDRVRRTQPGFFSHSTAWWEHRVLLDEESQREGGTAQFRLVYEEAGEPRGYVIYRVSGSWENWLPNRTVRVLGLISETPAAYLALWQYIFGVDLIKEIEAPERSTEEPLYWMLSDPRRLERRIHDALWVRLVDVPAALSGRRYACEGRVVFDVHDSFVPEWSGRYVLEGGPAGSICKETTETADVELDVRDLGALYLGAHSTAPLVMASRVTGDKRALQKVDAMFRWSQAPWCPEVF
jgi:predicted acetyltransferase